MINLISVKNLVTLIVIFCDEDIYSSISNDSSCFEESLAPAIVDEM